MDFLPSAFKALCDLAPACLLTHLVPLSPLSTSDNTGSPNTSGLGLMKCKLGRGRVHGVGPQEPCKPGGPGGHMEVP